MHLIAYLEGHKLKIPSIEMRTVLGSNSYEFSPFHVQKTAANKISFVLKDRTPDSIKGL